MHKFIRVKEDGGHRLKNQVYKPAHTGIKAASSSPWLKGIKHCIQPLDQCISRPGLYFFRYDTEHPLRNGLLLQSCL